MAAFALRQWGAACALALLVPAPWGAATGDAVACGVGAMPASPTFAPLVHTTEHQPLIYGWIHNVGQLCGPHAANVTLAGPRAMHSGAASVASDPSSDTYALSWRPPVPLPPGPYVAVFDFSERCCNVLGDRDRGVLAIAFLVDAWAMAAPRVHRHGDGTCSVWNDDARPNGAHDADQEWGARVPCVNPKLAPGTPPQPYDDMDDDGVVDPGESLLPSATLRPGLRRVGDGTCVAFADADGDAQPDPGELATPPVPCPNPRVAASPDGGATLYDDRDDDAQPGAGETLASVPPPRAPRLPSPRTSQGPDGTAVYDDADGDGQEDPGERVATIPVHDADQDNVPDEVEAEICGPPGNRELLGLLQGNGGACASSVDYAPPRRYGGVSLPTAVLNGSDADADGWPTEVTVKRVTLFLHPFEPSPVRVESAPDLVLPLDPDDADPNVPLLSVVASPVPVVVAHEVGGDVDDDGVPGGVVLHRATLVVDRRDAGSALRYSPAPSETHPLDPDDADPNVPLPSVFGPVRIPREVVGVDRDGDRVPGSFRIAYLDVTVDRRPSRTLLTTAMGNETLDLGVEDDARRGAPVPFDAFDADGDDLPDAIEPILCARQNDNRPEDGTCPTADRRDYRAPWDAPNPWVRS